MKIVNFKVVSHIFFNFSAKNHFYSFTKLYIYLKYQ